MSRSDRSAQPSKGRSGASQGGSRGQSADRSTNGANGEPSSRTRQLNRRERMDLILLRDGPYCVWCSAPLDNTPGSHHEPTTEHLVPRIKGGPSWIENELAACRRCNNERGHQSPAGWLQDCWGMGRTPRPEVINAALERLQTAITEKGGQRRARPYIATQLRRLRRM